MNHQNDSNTINGPESAGAQQQEGSEKVAGTDTGSTGTTETGAEQQEGEAKTDAETTATDRAATPAANDAEQSTTTIQHGGDKTVVYFGQIPLQPVESSQILGIGHHAETNTLAIRFKDKGERLYHYANVDAELFDRFRNAESIGSFFYDEIRLNKDHFPYFRIREEVAAQAA